MPIHPRGAAQRALQDSGASRGTVEGRGGPSGTSTHGPCVHRDSSAPRTPLVRCADTPDRNPRRAIRRGRIAAHVPLLRRAAAPHLRRPRHVAAVRELRAGGARQRDGALLPAARQDLRELPARAARGVRDGRGHLQRIRVLLVLLGLLGRARARVRRHGGRALRPRPRQPGRGGREQRRLPAAARRRARHPGARHRAGRQRRQGRAGARDRDARPLLRARHRPRPRRRGAPRRPDRRQQRDGARPGPQRLRRRPRDPAGRRGRRHDRVAAPAAAGRGQPVRHHLPRALPVLLAA